MKFTIDCEDRGAKDLARVLREASKDLRGLGNALVQLSAKTPAAGIFRRDVGDGEHAEINIGERVGPASLPSAAIAGAARRF